MGNIGPAEVAIVAIIALLILGPKKLPAAGRSLGGSMREFKNGITGHGEAPEPEPEELEAPTGTATAPVTAKLKAEG